MNLHISGVITSPSHHWLQILKNILFILIFYAALKGILKDLKFYFGWNFSTFVPVKVVERLLVRPQLLQPLVAVELVHDVLSACVVRVRAEERMYDGETLISSAQCWLTNLQHIINTVPDKLYTLSHQLLTKLFIITSDMGRLYCTFLLLGQQYNTTLSLSVNIMLQSFIY